jgi:hypothetical protein
VDAYLAFADRSSAFRVVLGAEPWRGESALEEGLSQQDECHNLLHRCLVAWSLAAWGLVFKSQQGIRKTDFGLKQAFDL